MQDSLSAALVIQNVPDGLPGGRIAQGARSAQAAPEPGATKLQETRRAVVQRWHAAADRALEDGFPHLAEQIWKRHAAAPDRERAPAQ